jgi:hypothetical protein
LTNPLTEGVSWGREQRRTGYPTTLPPPSQLFYEGVKHPAQQEAIERAVRVQLQAAAGRERARERLRAMPPGPSRRRLWELLTEAEIIHDEGG